MPPTHSQRILVRGVNWLGDAVMSTPALQRLREARPGARITLLTHAKLKDLWRNHPAIDAVETFDDTENAWRIGRRLRAQKFDLGLLLPNSPRSALELWLAGIPQRIGYARPWRNMFLTQAIPPRPGAIAMHKRSVAEINQLIREGAPQPAHAAGVHHLHQYLHLTAALGAKPEPLPPTWPSAPKPSQTSSPGSISPPALRKPSPVSASTPARNTAPPNAGPKPVSSRPPSRFNARPTAAGSSSASRRKRK